jgi:hypothetical protein
MSIAHLLGNDDLAFGGEVGLGRHGRKIGLTALPRNPTAASFRTGLRTVGQRASLHSVDGSKVGDWMAANWQEAVWAAILRQTRLNGSFTRQQLLAEELQNVVISVGSQGATPGQTLSRVLQELRDDGVLIFDGNGQYRVADGLAAQSVDAAVATEAWRLQKARLGQGPFRTALMIRWDGACPLTGIREPALLRASHIVPWNRCETDAERLNPENGLLLSALWDAAFDRGLISFGDDGAAIASPRLAIASFANLQANGVAHLSRLRAGNRERLGWHRQQWTAKNRRTC